MEWLPSNISIVLILQITVTVILVGIFGLITSRREANADHRGKCNTILLAAFLIENSPAIKTIADIAEATPSQVADAQNEIYWTNSLLDTFQKTGKLPDAGTGAESGWRLELLALSAAPISALLALNMVCSEEYRYRSYRVYHTEHRTNYMSKCLMLMAGSLIYLGVAATMWALNTRTFGIFLGVFALLGILSAATWMLLLTWWQQLWKDYWSERLLAIMGAASHDADHNLFNKAFNLKVVVDSQPVIPLNGGVGLYVAMFSAIQATIVVLARWLKIS
jgi:hypothetical protein